MKVLVTGGCGFLGSHTCEFYVNRGDHVISFDNMTKYELARTGYATDKARDYNWNLLSALGVEMVQGDICNYEQLLETGHTCDFIIHTAAQPAMTISIENPGLDFLTNVQGTFNVLNVAKKLKIPFVSCSSIHVYGNEINQTLTEAETRYLRTPPEIDEQQPILAGTITPLHASKRSAEIYVQSFIDTYQLEAASFRLTGLYGPRQFGGEDHGWLANFCIRAVLDWPITVFGTSKQVRDILFVTDAVEACQAFYESRKPGIYNIGGGYKHSISLQECLDLIAEVLGKDIPVTLQDKRLGDLWYFVCDVSKAKQMLNWQAKVPPEEGIRRLIAWLNDNLDCFQA